MWYHCLFLHFNMPHFDSSAFSSSDSVNITATWRNQLSTSLCFRYKKGMSHCIITFSPMTDTVPKIYKCWHPNGTLFRQIFHLFSTTTYCLMITKIVRVLVASKKVTKLTDSKSLRLSEHTIFDTCKQIQQRHTNTTFQTQTETSLLNFKIFPLILFIMLTFLVNPEGTAWNTKFLNNLRFQVFIHLQ